MSENALQDAYPESKPEERDDTYYIEGDLDAMGHLTACSQCGRKILVEMALFGVAHPAGLTVICGECLVLPDKFRKEQPEIVAKIERWLRRVRENKQEQSGIACSEP